MEANKPMPWKPQSHRPRQRESRRLSAAKRGYDRRWRDYDKKDGAADRYLAEHPLCVECEKEGKVVPATNVDHIVPHRGDPVLFWAEGNWQGLCATHHSIKTAKGQ